MRVLTRWSKRILIVMIMESKGYGCIFEHTEGAVSSAISSQTTVLSRYYDNPKTEKRNKSMNDMFLNIISTLGNPTRVKIVL